MPKKKKEERKICLKKLVYLKRDESSDEQRSERLLPFEGQVLSERLR
jgi:hypothetical protein